MSEPSRRQHRLEDSLHDIIDNIARIESYVVGLTSEDLRLEGMRYDAVERCLERICEATTRLGGAAAKLMPKQPWQDIRGMGNRLRHAYDHVDIAVVWRVITDRLPELKADAGAALQKLQECGHQSRSGS